MPTSLEFPYLAKVTNNMNPVLLAQVKQSLETFSIEVRIDYERWTQYCMEYESWLAGSEAAKSCDNSVSITYEKEEEAQNET
jgi:hypothetical protein